MKAVEFLKVLYEEEEKLKNQLLLEWCCSKCGAEDLPDENKECPDCHYVIPQELNDQIREVYSKIYDKVFGQINRKLIENDLVGTNTMKFVTKLKELGIIKKLRSGRLVEFLKIPKEFVVGCFIEGKDGMRRLRQMAWRRKRNMQEE